MPGEEAAAALAASAATPHTSAASSAEHAQLVQRLEQHMIAHSLSQAQVVKAANLSSAGKLSLWLGRSKGRSTEQSLAETYAVSGATMVETYARIAAYLDGAPIPPAPTATWLHPLQPHEPHKSEWKWKPCCPRLTASSPSSTSSTGGAAAAAAGAAAAGAGPSTAEQLDGVMQDADSASFRIPMVTGQPPPKQPRTPGPFVIFCKAERPKIVKANPSMTFGSVS